MDKVGIPCRIKVQSGSINGEPKFTWIDATVTNKSGLDRYVVRQVNGDGLYFLTADEIWVNWAEAKKLFNKIF